MTLSLVRRALLLLLAVAIAACDAATPASLPATKSTAPSPVTTVASETPRPAPSSDVRVRPGEAWIVYQGGSGGPPRIRLVRPDGTGDHELTPAKAPGEQFHPDWSHDGQRIAFAIPGPDGIRDLWIADADGANARVVFDCAPPCMEADDPAWSPDDTRLAFHQFNAVGDDGLGTGSIEILDLADGTIATASTGAETEYLYAPRWDPTGTRIVIEIDRFDSARLDASVVREATIGIIDLTVESPAFEALLPWETFAGYPDWSPDGNLIVFQAPLVAGTDPADIHVVDVDGSHERVLTNFAASGGWGIQPTWTPNGERIMFVGEDVVRTSPNAATIRADGTGLERMGSDGTRRTHPRLRPGS